MHQLPVQLRHKEFYSIGAGQHFAETMAAQRQILDEIF